MRAAALFLLPFAAAFAQTAEPAPRPEVDQALRARVSEFFQDHVDGKFSKAYALVAEDTKEYYFAAQKVQLKSYQIKSVKFAPDFETAEVDVTGQRMWVLRPDLPPTIIPVEMKTHWKLEHGQWMFYTHSHPTLLSSMDPSEATRERPSAPSDGAPAVPNPQQMQDLAQAVLQQQPALDRNEILLPLDKPSTEKIVFHNSQNGEVKVYLGPFTPIPGFTATLDKDSVSGNQNAVITIHFDPKETSASLAPFTLRVISEPLSRVYPVTIKFAPRPPAR